MAVQFFDNGGSDPRLRQQIAAQLIGQAIGGFGQVRQATNEREALAQLLAGKPAEMGKGLSGGPGGLDPKLAGPALALTGGGMAKPAVPGVLETGTLTPQQVQAFMLQGGDPRTLAGFMPKPISPFEQASLGLEREKIGVEREKLAQPQGPQSSIGKIIADFGGDPRNPTDIQRATEIMRSTQAGTTVVNRLPPQFPQAPGGYHYEGDFGSGDVRLVPTPGGPAALELQQKADEEANAAEFVAGETTGVILPAIERARQAVSDPEYSRRWAGYAPGFLTDQQTAQLRGDVETVKANLTFEKLRSLPKLTPISEEELRQVAAAAGAIDLQNDSPQVIQQKLATVESVYNRMLEKASAVAGAHAGSEPSGVSGGPQAAGEIGEGTIATNPQTGESLILRNGQWVPL